jgi:GH25 family lysozyme M1 (1,4-beta-N-acetylmuramidase)
MPRLSLRSAGVLLSGFLAATPLAAFADTTVNTVWADQSRALVLDAYEYNSFDLHEIAKNPRIAAFIHKGSDGLPPRWGCPQAQNQIEKDLCKKDWKVYSVGKELYQARRGLAKSLGLKWGAYHLARPGNPREQANHFLEFTDPQPDDLIALDIEEINPERFMSLEDAEEFSRHIYRRIGRYPVLYTNGSTAKFIADNATTYPLLSRMQLWYARYKQDIVGHFPKGNWDNYALWQFVSQVNCGHATCPYRIAGTSKDIDINVSALTPDQLKKAWPLDGLLPVRGKSTTKDWAHPIVATALVTISGFPEMAFAVLERAKVNLPKKPPAPLFVPEYGVDLMETSAVSVAFINDRAQRRCSRLISRQPMSDL